MDRDPDQARYLRKHYAENGQDQEQEEEDKQFNKNFQQALKHHSKNAIKNNIQEQVEYFGTTIEPFNMRDQEEMGQMDQDGFFVFKRHNQYKDAWLDSIEEGNDMMLADKLKKKIKTEGGRFQTVYEGQRVVNQDYKQQQQEASQESNNELKQGEQQNNQQNQNEEQEPFTAKQLKQLLVQLLPQNKSANNYLKQLKKNIKKEDNKELHDKILQICNKYIAMTDQYDILTLKKQQLQAQFDKQESQELNWDDEQQQKQKQKQKQKQEQDQPLFKKAKQQEANLHKNDEEENDDIF